MVTRDIKKNTATQVNANLIGVQVHPDVVPPTYEVSELTANVGINHFGCSNKSNGLTMVCSSGNADDVWAYTGTQEEHNSTVYNVWSCLTDVTNPNMLTISTDTITDQTQFYMYLDDPNNPVVVPTFVSSYMLTYEGVLYRFDPNDSYVYIPDSADTCDVVDGFVINKDTGLFIGKIVSEEYGYEQFACGYDSESGVYFQWRLDYDVEIYLYSTVRNPAVGSNLISNNAGTESYTSPVLTVTEREVEPGYTEAVDCTLSYSVDGSTWTDWPENMTDDNNVISNIPRYMYLKFSQDVVITEE